MASRQDILKGLRGELLRLGRHAVELHKKIKKRIIEAKKSTGRYPSSDVKNLQLTNEQIGKLEKLLRTVDRELGK